MHVERDNVNETDFVGTVKWQKLRQNEIGCLKTEHGDYTQRLNIVQENEFAKYCWTMYDRNKSNHF